MFDDKTLQSLVKEISVMRPNHLRDFQKLTVAIVEKDAEGIRRIQGKWSGKAYSERGCYLLAQLAREAEAAFPVTFNIEAAPEEWILRRKPEYRGGYTYTATYEQVQQWVYNHLQLRADACGFCGILTVSRKNVKVRAIRFPETDQNAEPVYAFHLPIVKHVKCVVYAKMEGRGRYWRIWISAGADYHFYNPVADDSLYGFIRPEQLQQEIKEGGFPEPYKESE